jgi:hypothetical protein
MSTAAPALFRGQKFEKKTGSALYTPSCAVVVPQLPVQNFMAPSGKAFEAHGGVLLPAIGAQATVVSFVVPKGNNGFIRRIGNVFVGGGFTDFSGAVVWQIILNQSGPTGPVVAPGFDNIIASLGSVAIPSMIDGIHIFEGALVALIVKNISVVVAGQFIGGRLGGSFHSIPHEPPDLAF